MSETDGATVDLGDLGFLDEEKLAVLPHCIRLETEGTADSAELDRVDEEGRIVPKTDSPEKPVTGEPVPKLSATAAERLLGAGQVEFMKDLEGEYGEGFEELDRDSYDIS